MSFVGRGQRLGAQSEASLSKVVALALRDYVASQPGRWRGGVKVESARVVRASGRSDEPLTLRVRELVDRHGREKVAAALVRACYEEGARDQAAATPIARKG